MAEVTDLSAGLHDSISESFSLRVLIMKDREEICAAVKFLMNFVSGNTVSKFAITFFFLLLLFLLHFLIHFLDLFSDLHFTFRSNFLHFLIHFF